MSVPVEQTRRLVHQRLALEHVANPAGANPYIWQRSNKSVIEQQVSRRRVRNVRGGGAGAPPPPDAFGLGAGFPCRKLAGTRGVGSRKTAGKSSAGAVDVDILAVRVPKRAPTVAAARAAERAWKIYDAHRQLSLSAYVPHTYGFHDAGSDGTEGSGDGSLAAVDIYYEHTPSRSLARCFAEFSSSSFADEYSSSSSSSSSFFQFGEQHVLFQHWVRESIRALLDLQRMSAYELRSPLTWHNLLVGNQGTSLRLGALPWGDRIDGSSGRPIAAAVTERNDLLLAQPLHPRHVRGQRVHLGLPLAALPRHEPPQELRHARGRVQPELHRRRAARLGGLQEGLHALARDVPAVAGPAIAGERRACGAKAGDHRGLSLVELLAEALDRVAADVRVASGAVGIVLGARRSCEARRARGEPQWPDLRAVLDPLFGGVFGAVGLAKAAATPRPSTYRPSVQMVSYVNVKFFQRSAAANAFSSKRRRFGAPRASSDGS